MRPSDVVRTEGRKLIRPFHLALLVPGWITPMNQKKKTIVKQVLTEAVDVPHFFNLSDAQRLNWMIERAYELGKTTPSRKHRGRAVPNRPQGATLELVIRLRPKPADSGRRK